MTAAQADALLALAGRFVVAHEKLAASAEWISRDSMRSLDQEYPQATGLHAAEIIAAALNGLVAVLADRGAP